MIGKRNSRSLHFGRDDNSVIPATSDRDTLQPSNRIVIPTEVEGPAVSLPRSPFHSPVGRQSRWSSRQSISGSPASRSWQPNVFGPPVPLFPGLSDCATAGLGLACSFTDPVEIDPGSLDAVHPGHHGPKQ